MSTTADPRRQWAQTFGGNAERYDRTRPGYPQAMVEAIVAAAPGPDVLDVGCGTGIAARQFQSAGCKVLGVEVDARMADLARQAGLAVEVGRFEDWDPGGRAFDAVIAGQAWHWIDAVTGAARAAAALRPGGRLAAFWNVSQPSPELAKAFCAVYRRMPGPLADAWARPVPDAYSVLLTTAADGIRGVGAFGDPEQWRYEWERPYTRQDWLDQVPTFGGHAQLPPEKLEELLAGIGAAIDAAGGAFTMRYTTVVLTAARAGSSR